MTQGSEIQRTTQWFLAQPAAPFSPLHYPVGQSLYSVYASDRIGMPPGTFPFPPGSVWEMLGVAYGVSSGTLVFEALSPVRQVVW